MRVCAYIHVYACTHVYLGWWECWKDKWMKGCSSEQGSIQGKETSPQLFLASFFLRRSTLRWLSSCGIRYSLAATWRLGCPGARGILLPRPGIELVWKSLLLPSSYCISLFLFVKLVNKSSTGSSGNINLGHRFLPPVFVTFKMEHTSPLGVEAVWGINLVITVILLERKNSQVLSGPKCYW